VIVGITQNIKKPSFLSIEDRINAANIVLSDIENTEVQQFDNLLVDFVYQQNAHVILRGLRAVSDFEYEFQLSGMNKRLRPDIETLFMTPSEQYANISSSLVREILVLGGDISAFVPESVEKLLKSYIKN
jgi:pantetheine-phosphate adenylyltransferase